jgi:hypothetical protein
MGDRIAEELEDIIVRKPFKTMLNAIRTMAHTIRPVMPHTIDPAAAAVGSLAERTEIEQIADKHRQKPYHNNLPQARIGSIV